jgi:hypothetical protein
VEAASFTVTFCPAGVVRVKLDADTLSTVPDDPPAAAAERALDPLPPALLLPAPEFAVAIDGADALAEAAVVDDEDVAHAAVSPTIAHINVAVTMRPRFFDASTHGPGTSRRGSVCS